MIKYVVGFAFSTRKKDVLLMKKNKPEWQKDKYNGLGGTVNIQENETAEAAMVREFKEECGIETEEKDWGLFAVIRDESNKNVKLYCFRTFTNKIYDCQSTEAEQVEVLPVNLIAFPVVYNLKYLIPMAMDETLYTSFIDAKLNG